MSFFDDVRRAFGGDPDASTRAASQAFQYAALAMDQAYQRLFKAAVLPWIQRVVENVPRVWYHPDVQRRCDMQVPGGTCTAHAAGMCVVCRRDVCLTHAYVCSDATIVCAGCVNVARKHVDPIVNMPPNDSERREQPPPKRGPTKDDVEKAYELLGVDEDSTEREIRRAYKELLAKWHPDHAPPDRKGRFEERFKRIRWAYDVVTDHRKREAA